MPIKPENKKRYPKDWKAIRAKMLDRAGQCCELCHLENYSVIYRETWGKPRRVAGALDHKTAKIHAKRYEDMTNVKPSIVILTIAHINQTPEDNRPCNLLALCQRCHNKIDAPYRVLNAAETREKAKGAPCL